MGYQEILVRSSKISLEKIAETIQNKADPLFVDSANTMAILKRDVESDKVIIFGQERDIDPLNFKAGDQFLVVCGDRDTLKSVKNMFPFMQRKSIETYPIELIMQTPQNLNKEYSDVFEDSKFLREKEQGRGKTSILQKLSENKRVIMGSQKSNMSLTKQETKQSEHLVGEER